MVRAHALTRPRLNYESERPRYQADPQKPSHPRASLPPADQGCSTFPKPLRTQVRLRMSTACHSSPATAGEQVLLRVTAPATIRWNSIPTAMLSHPERVLRPAGRPLNLWTSTTTVTSICCSAAILSTMLRPSLSYVGRESSNRRASGACSSVAQPLKARAYPVPFSVPTAGINNGDKTFTKSTTILASFTDKHQDCAVGDVRARDLEPAVCCLPISLSAGNSRCCRLRAMPPPAHR